MKTTKITKSVCERYDIREDNGCGWAVIVLDERGGMLSIQSDYGNWSHMWPHHGRKSFKHFILEMDKDHHYLIGKLGGRGTEFDFDASVKNLKKAIGRAYGHKRLMHYAGGRREVFDKDKCTEAIDAIEYLDDTRSADDFCRQLYERSEFNVIDSNDYECIVVKHDSYALTNFLKRLWPIFCEALRQELEGK